MLLGRCKCQTPQIMTVELQCYSLESELDETVHYSAEQAPSLAQLLAVNWYCEGVHYSAEQGLSQAQLLAVNRYR